MEAPKKIQTREEVALDYITGQIASGSLKAGDKLPNEKDLAGQLGISRTPIREAMKSPSIAGLIDIRHSHGSYVREPQSAPALPLSMFQLYLQDSTPEMLMELRDVFNRNCNELAALRRMDACENAGMHRSIEGPNSGAGSSLDEMLEADLDFHRAVYEATGNKLIAVIADFVLTMVAPWVRKSLHVSGRRRAVHLHEQMSNAILRRQVGADKRFSVDAKSIEGTKEAS